MRGSVAAVVVAALLAAALSAEIALRAQESPDASGDEAEAAAAPPERSARSGRGPATMGRDKAGIEAYLTHRLAVIETQHKARLDFVARDSREWSEFWETVKKQRKLFEVRIARLRLDTFESLGSLDPKDHAKSIQDFEMLQNHQFEIFESDQKKKIAEFFARRVKKWTDYYAAQERDRSTFAAEADASWDQLKAAIRLQTGPGSSATKPKYQ